MYDLLRSLSYRVLGGRTELLGAWERVGDSFAGCVVRVERTPQGVQGQITYVPLAMEPYGWQIGDVKWKDFVPRRVVGYRVQDLFKELDPETGRVKRTGFAESRIRFVGPDEIVVLPRGGTAVRSTRWCRSNATV